MIVDTTGAVLQWRVGDTMHWIASGGLFLLRCGGVFSELSEMLEAVGIKRVVAYR